MTEPQNNTAEPESKAPVDPGPTLEWNCHPATRKPWVTIGVTLFIVVCAVLVYPVIIVTSMIM